MVNISKRPLDDKLAKQLSMQLVKLIATTNKNTASSMIDGLLTESEQVMLAKRFAVILMLDQKYPKQSISHLLKMSRTTIIAIERAYKKGRYDGVLRAADRYAKSEKTNVLDTIEIILRLGMPSMGKDRWKWLDRHLGQQTRLKK